MTEAQWATFETRLRTFVGSRVDPRSVDDVVGDILLKLVRHRDRIEAASNPLAYVQRVASNAVADFYRRRSTERRALADFEREADVIAEAGTLSGEDATDGLERCLAPFIENLPEKYRDALLLTDVEGLTQPEAAKRLGLSVSGMKSRVQRGRARVKQALLECCVVELDRLGGIAEFHPRPDSCGGECSS